MKTKIVAVIPARLASQRFPNKPLLSIAGLPMIEHVRRRALLCRGFSKVVVATCDEAIANVVRSFDGEVIMTAATHRVATERIVEAVEKIDCSHVINVQGDEILVLPSDLEKMISLIQERPEQSVWNAVAHIENEEELKDTSIVKCVLSRSGNVFYFSRFFSFWVKPIHWVIGLLGYRRDFLQNFSKLPRGILEEKESIEQMRFLENDISIASVLFEKAYPGINEEREVEVVKKYLSEDPLQKAILKRIL